MGAPGRAAAALQGAPLKTQLQREQLRLVRKAMTYGRGAQTLRHEVAIRRIRAELEPLLQARP
jgi:hypothetical protein